MERLTAQIRSGGPDYDHSHAVVQAPGGAFVMAGRSDSFVNGSCAYLVKIGPELIAGDANGSGEINVSDLLYLVDMVFRGGPDPVHLNAADVDGDCVINNRDIVYLVDHVFMSGPPPVVGWLG